MTHLLTMRYFTSILISLTIPAFAQWKFDQAPVRVTVQLAGSPTHDTAGYHVHIEDGGVLPKPFIRPVAVDAAGNELKAYTLWENAETGVDILFESPKKKGDVVIYLGPSNQPVTWRPDSGLTPSALLCTQPGLGSQAGAQQLASLGAVNRMAHVRNRAGSKQAPLSVPGDLMDRGGAVSLYMQAYLNVTDPGDTWISPLTFSGGNVVRIDGQTLSPQKKNNKPGGVGASMNLSKGLHRLEVLAWAPNSGNQNGLMTLIWKTPKTDVKSLGGVRPSDLPYPGESMWAARPLRNDEVVRSGAAMVKQVEFKAGGPIARVNAVPVANYWMGNERPLLVYKLSADAAGQPAGTRYTWNFGGGAALSKPEVYWIVPGGRDFQVALTATAGAVKSTAQVSFYPFTTRKTDLNNAGDREHFRRAAMDVMEAYPADKDPTENWTASHWNNFFRTLELNKGQDLLNHVFRVRWDSLKGKIPAEKQAALQEVFLDFLPRTSPDTALKWTETFERDARTPYAKGMMKIRRSEIFMYYKGEPDTARKILEPILQQNLKDEVSEWARIRYGDIQFLAGDLNEATKMYGNVQNRSGHTLGKPKRDRSTEPDTPEPLKGLAKSKAEMEAQKQARLDRMKSVATTAQAGPSDGTTLIDNQRIADWKVNALVDASYSEQVKSLIQQGFLLEAKHALDDWERNFPLSKVSNDFIINEAHFYMAMEDWTRAAVILDAYCDQIDASSFIPPAVEALLTCKIKLKEPREPMIAFCEKMRKKLEFHPAVKRIDDILDQLK
ncbi:MAG: hypothetical protein ACI9QL_003707 [Candidatus Omnitrophota bacterium]|jgi:hypothetical protein